jgi:hypothetical protein
MKNLLRYASKIATTMPLAVVLMSVVSSSAIAQFTTAAASQGNQNNTNNMATGSQAVQSYSNMGDTSVGRMGSYGGSLQASHSAYQAPYSTNSAGLPSAQFTYGFNSHPFPSLGSVKATGGQYLPSTSTASNDLNIVNNSNYLLSGGSLGIPVNIPPLVPLVNNAVINSTQALQGLNTLFGQ